ncbi:MAG TPA: hypothetical protein VH913_17770 [Hyphomicrobiaceae bacterium]
MLVLIVGATDVRASGNEQVEHIPPLRLDGNVQRLRSAAPIWMRANGVGQPRFPRECRLHVMEAAVSDGTQESRNGLVGRQRGCGRIGLPEMIDMGLQLAPTREAVLPSNGDLRLRKLRLAALQTHGAEMLLCSFA